MLSNNFLLRCSSIGSVMSAATRGRTISVGAETFCKEWLINKLTDKAPEFVTSKYMEKGTICEDGAIEYLGEVMGLFYAKNEQYLKNSHIKGTPDIITHDTIIDIKCPWNARSMPYFDTAINKDYWYQLQGYMALANKPKARLIYVLMNTPEHIVEQELKKRLWSNPDLDTVDAAKEYKFEHLPQKLRIKIFDFERNDEAISKIYKRVNLMRDYIKNLETQLS